MRRNDVTAALLALVGLLAIAAPGAAQTPAKPDSTTKIPVADSVKLVFDREVFGYGGGHRRDPFQPLTGKNAASMGPRFQELRLVGTIFSQQEPSRSLATVIDATGKRHRVRRGDVIGNTRIVEIGSRRIVVIVQNFGLERREVLELQKEEGQEGSS